LSSFDGLGRAHRSNAVSDNRDRLGDGVATIDSDDFTATQHEICILRKRWHRGQED
jgi:hypothetical protein